MDLITKLLRKTKVFDDIWVIVECLTKSSYFLAIWESSSAEKLADIYVHEIISHHGALVSTVSDSTCPIHFPVLEVVS